MSSTPKLDNIFRYYGIEKPSKEFDSFQGNAKSKTSIISKLKRKIEMSRKTKFTVADIKDLSRCAVLLDSFSDAPQFIKELKNIFPDLKGDISRNINGYKGVHLNISVNGVTAEIQISTKEAWPYKVASEEYYAKWRDFDADAEESELQQKQFRLESLKEEYQSNPNAELKTEITNLSKEIFSLHNEFNGKISLKNNELQDTQEMFDELFTSSDFNSAEREIETLLLSYDLQEANEAEITEQAKSNKNVLSTPIALSVDGKVDIEKNSSLLDNCIEIANAAQINLEENIRGIINNYSKENVTDDERSNVQSLLIDIMQEYDLSTAEYFKDSDFVKTHGLDIAKQRVFIASSVTKYAKQNQLLGKPCLEVLETFYEEIRNNAKIKPVDLLSIRRMVNKTLTLENVNEQTQDKEK